MARKHVHGMSLVDWFNRDTVVLFAQGLGNGLTVYRKIYKGRTSYAICHSHFEKRLHVDPIMVEHRT